MLETYIIELDSDFFSGASDRIIEVVVKHSHFTVKDAQALFEAIQKCKSVRILRIHWCEFENQAFHFAAETVAKSQSISILELEDVTIDPKGIQ